MINIQGHLILCVQAKSHVQICTNVCVCVFLYTTMQQSVEQSWSKLHGEVSSSTLYCSVHGSLSRTSFSTFQSVSYKRKTNLVQNLY